MENKKRLLKKCAVINIEQYLAEYITNKCGIDKSTGGVKIPNNSDLYFAVWELMSRPRVNCIDSESGNLRISLPHRHHGIDGTPWKNPIYYNYISQSSAKEIEKLIRLMFNFELHRILWENEEFGRKKRNLDIAYEFLRKYNIESITSDAILKNWYRYRNRICYKKPRKYEK